MIALIFGLVGLIIDIVVILVIAGSIVSLPFYLVYKLTQVIKIKEAKYGKTQIWH